MFENWGIWVLLLVVAVVAWARYLQHKETLRMLERGLESRDVLELSNTMRLRKGLILGIGLLALGAGLGAGLSLATDAGVIQPAAAAALTGLAVFLFALGSGTVFLHILWMRQASVVARGKADQPSEPAEPER
jgi:hypothetical protein